MVDIIGAWQAFIKELNNAFPNYTYEKSNQKGNQPDYPYTAINCTTPYARDMDNLRGNEKYSNVVNDDTKVQLQRIEQPKMTFSFNCYSDKLQTCLQMLEDTKDWILQNKQVLQEYGIVVLNIDSITDRTTFLEIDYQYHWGFDLTIRVIDVINMQINAVNKVKITNKNSNENFEIGGN